MSREMKDSGVEYIGSIPSDWDRIKFGFAINRLGTGLNPRDNFILTKTDDLFYVTIRNFKNNALYLDNNCDRISKEAWLKIQNRSQLEAGDILFASISDIPQIYLLRDKPTNWNINESVFCIKVGPLYDKRFFCYVLSDSVYYADLRKDATGATFKSIKQNKLIDSSIVLPPILEQRQIVHFLDRKCSAIDTAIEKTKESIEKLEEYKKAVITKAVTKGLNPDVKMKDSGIEWIGEIPETWEVKQLRKFYSRRLNKNKCLQEKNLLSLSYGNIIRKNIDTKEGLLPESFDGYNIVEADDIVIRGTDLQNDHRSLRTGLVKERGIITSAYMTLKPKAGVNSEYYHYLLHCYDIEKVFYSMGGGLRQSLDYWDFIRTYVLVPSEQEQMDIVNYIHKKCASVDSLIAKKQEAINKWEEYKKSLIYYAVTGKIDCRNEVANVES